ncbi:hypothetical protein C7972_10381 [Arenibacter sp. ARW7G5Y1]|nr:hypothetical protein C7972_10381 [Arenibacter sp. ARW7G5Y1]
MLRIWAMQKMNRIQTLDSKLYFFVIHTQLLGLIHLIALGEGYLPIITVLYPLYGHFDTVWRGT